MKLRFVAIMAMCLVALVATPMSASTIVPTNESHWSQTAPQLGVSWDGNPPGTFVDLFDNVWVDEWLVDSSGTNPGTFVLSPGSYDATVVGRYSAYAELNQLAIAPVSDPGSWTTIFEGSDPLWSQKTFLVSAPSNLVLLGPGGTFYSGNAPGHFLAGRSVAGGYQFWVGTEDLPLSWGDSDYQDFKFGLSGTPAPVPEPTTSLLLGACLCGLAFLRRRKRS